MQHYAQYIYFDKNTRDIKWIEFKALSVVVYIPKGLEAINLTESDFHVSKCKDTPVEDEFYIDREAFIN